LLALSSDERWSVAFVEAELLPTLVRAGVPIEREQDRYVRELGERERERR
jgi:hypothetical protein